MIQYQIVLIVTSSRQQGAGPYTAGTVLPDRADAIQFMQNLNRAERRSGSADRYYVAKHPTT